MPRESVAVVYCLRIAGLLSPVHLGARSVLLVVYLFILVVCCCRMWLFCCQATLSFVVRSPYVTFVCSHVHARVCVCSLVVCVGADRVEQFSVHHHCLCVDGWLCVFITSIPSFHPTRTIWCNHVLIIHRRCVCVCVQCGWDHFTVHPHCLCVDGRALVTITPILCHIISCSIHVSCRLYQYNHP